VPDVVDVLVFLYLHLLKIGQILMVKMVLYRRVVVVAQIHAAELALGSRQRTRMRWFSMSSPTMERERNLVCNLYRLGLLSRDRRRRLSSMVSVRSMVLKAGSWSACQDGYRILYRRGRGRWPASCGRGGWVRTWPCGFPGRYRQS
jgi:hypothetical protein